MDRPEIKKQLETIFGIVDEQILKRTTLQEETSIREGLGLDSLQLTELLFEIEERLDVKISDEEAQKVRTIGDMISLIETKVPKDAKKTAK
jgi:acyl carrier protein